MKRIVIKAGKKLNIKIHRHSEEHGVVV
ncbi:hypothetical protein IF202_08720 [Marinomonas sp. SM2066]|uniref:Uncharacterized protein n=1 Tax=Marinomonas colpomeniae TaxID=2774408 RepID=A0ABR8NYM7_9GAMM|nr:hypothetical protein [Marinomonas colpomeniae]